MIGLAALGGYWVWRAASDAGWLPHDAIAIVSAKGWSTGEYKTCTEANVVAMKDEPQIDCPSVSEDSEYSEPKRFKVRFYGATYQEESKDKASLIWRCRKNEGTDPTFTCDEKKIVRWDEKK